jgi:outer membrane protein
MSRTAHLRRGLLALAALLLACPQLSASETLTWQDCVRLVSQQNPDVRASQETLSSSEAQANAAYSGFMPQVSANASFNRGTSASFSGTTPSGSSTSDKYDASIDMSQNVFAGFADVGRVKQGKANRDVSKAALDVTKVQVSFDLKGAFATILYAQDYEALAQRIIKRREENALMVGLRFDAGIENKGSLLLAKSFLSQAKFDKTVAHHDFEVSRERLARVLGIDDSKDIRIAGKVPIEEPGKEPDFKAVVATLPAHQQAVAQERSSKAGVTVARSQFFPSVDIVGAVGRQGDTFFPDEDRNFVGVNFGVPIFNGAANYFNYRSASATSKASEAQRESVDRQALPNLRQAYRLFVEAVAKLKVDREFAEAAEVRAEISRAKYQNGLQSFEDWDIIESDLITKQKTVLQSERDVILAEAAWQQAQGRGSIP